MGAGDRGLGRGDFRWELSFSSTLEKIFEVRSGESFGFAAVLEITDYSVYERR